MDSSIKKSQPGISVIVPVKDCREYLPLLLSSLCSQTLPPKEVIIVDSSSHAEEENISSIVAKYEKRIPIIYKKVAFAYPGKARNIGCEMARYEWLAFVDVKTIPEEKWLEWAFATAKENNAPFVSGVTSVEADTYFKKILRAASYGCQATLTLPGTLIKKSLFDKEEGFIEEVRSSEDLEWRNRLKKRGVAVAVSPKVTVMRYYGLPDDILSALRKYYRNAMATAHTDTLLGQKVCYLSIVLVVMTLMVNKWNKVVAGGDADNTLFVPHIMKIYLAILLSLYIVFAGIVKPLATHSRIKWYQKFWLFSLVVMFSVFIHKWNYLVTGFNVNSILFVPHITKIFIFFLLGIAIFVRGVLFPLRRSVRKRFLFPFQWIMVGLIGALLDVAKIPGYFWGAVLKILWEPTLSTKRE